MKIVSKSLRASANGRGCTLRLPGICNHNPETTVLAHLACGQRGVGIKGPDTVACYACSACHAEIDLLINTDGLPARDVLRAIAETHAAMINAGVMWVHS